MIHQITMNKLTNHEHEHGQSLTGQGQTPLPLPSHTLVRSDYHGDPKFLDRQVLANTVYTVCYSSVSFGHFTLW